MILDNLIAQGSQTDVTLVMPLGYGRRRFCSQPPACVIESAATELRQIPRRTTGRVIPQIEKQYRVSKDRNARSDSRLSMGGAESLFVGLNAVDRFAWIGAFSSGGLSENFEETFPHLDPKVNSQLRLLWIACGTEDFLIGTNRKLRDWLKTKDVRHVAVETPGAHVWMVWRRNLAEFAGLLFR